MNTTDKQKCLLKIYKNLQNAPHGKKLYNFEQIII